MLNTDHGKLKTYFINMVESKFMEEVERNQNRRGRYGVSAQLPKGLDKHDITQSLEQLEYNVRIDNFGGSTYITAYKFVQ